MLNENRKHFSPENLVDRNAVFRFYQDEGIIECIYCSTEFVLYSQTFQGCPCWRGELPSFGTLDLRFIKEIILYTIQ